MRCLMSAMRLQKVNYSFQGRNEEACFWRDQPAKVVEALRAGEGVLGRHNDTELLHLAIDASRRCLCRRYDACSRVTIETSSIPECLCRRYDACSRVKMLFVFFIGPKIESSQNISTLMFLVMNVVPMHSVSACPS